MAELTTPAECLRLLIGLYEEMEGLPDLSKKVAIAAECAKIENFLIRMGRVNKETFETASEASRNLREIVKLLPEIGMKNLGARREARIKLKRAITLAGRIVATINSQEKRRNSPQEI